MGPIFHKERQIARYGEGTRVEVIVSEPLCGSTRVNPGDGTPVTVRNWRLVNCPDCLELKETVACP